MTKNFLLIAFSILFFFLYSALYFNSGFSFNNGKSYIFESPDETANWFFIKEYVLNDSLKADFLDSEYSEIIKPRSILRQNGYLVPTGFLGIVLILGSIGKLIGLNLVLFVIPLLASFTPLFFYYILKKFFNENISFLSSIFLYSHPAFFYFGNRSLLPNVLFVSLIILSIFFFTRLSSKSTIFEKMGYTYLGGFFAALGLITRLSESIWVSVLFLAIFGWLIYKIKLKFYWIGISVFVGLMILIPLLLINNNVYGHYFSTGYYQIKNKVAIQETIEQEQPLSINKTPENILFKILMPFGIDLYSIPRNGFNYFAMLFWWFFIPFVIGMILVFKNRKPEFVYYTFIFLIISLYLGFLYGSFKVFDNINKNITLGVSYIRYWLPIYIMALPLVVYCFDFFIKRKKNLIISGFLSISVFLGISLSVFAKEESLLSNINNIKNYKLQKQTVMDILDEDSMLITDRMDKVFFPEINVISIEHSPESYKNNLNYFKSILEDNKSLYIYSVMPQKDIDYLNSRIFNPNDLNLEIYKNIFMNFNLISVKNI